MLGPHCLIEKTVVTFGVCPAVEYFERYNSNTMSQDNMIKFECTECKTVNYFSRKNKKTLKTRLELMKFCKSCKKHTMHKETK